MDCDCDMQREPLNDILRRVVTVEEVYHSPKNNIVLHRKAIYNDKLERPLRNRSNCSHNSIEKTNHYVRKGKIYKSYRENINRSPTFYRNVENNTHACNEVDSVLISIEKQEAKNKFLLMCMLSVLILVFMGIYIAFTDERYVPVEVIQKIKDDLRNNILQQNEALNVITYNLNRINTVNTHITILPFVGTTGVGKTFSINIIKKWLPSHLCELSADQVTDLSALHVDNCQIIIIDNLKTTHLDAVIQFIQRLPNTQTFIVIPVFNIHDTKDGITFEINKEYYKSIRETFDASGLDFEIALFDEVKDQVVEQWLRQEFNKRQIEESRHNDLIKDLLSNNQVKNKGFKGLEAKLSVTS